MPGVLPPSSLERVTASPVVSNDPVVEGLVYAYAQGIFPMAEPGGPVRWYAPDPRGVIPLDDSGLRISRSLRKQIRSGRFRITTDRAFLEVITACAVPRPGQCGAETWIDGRIINAYARLHDAGLAHSVEAWLDGPKGAVLVGGIYGVGLGGLFSGESMFCRPDLGGTDASKVCIAWLWHHLRARGFTLFDTQYTTDHVRSLGGIEIPREAYHDRLGRALQIPTEWLPFSEPAL